MSKYTYLLLELFKNIFPPSPDPLPSGAVERAIPGDPRVRKLPLSLTSCSTWARHLTWAAY